MGFNSGFKGLIRVYVLRDLNQTLKRN